MIFKINKEKELDCRTVMISNYSKNFLTSLATK